MYIQTKKTHNRGAQFMQALQVHFTYKANNCKVADFCVVQSKTKRLTQLAQFETMHKIAAALNLKHFYDVTLTHYNVCK